MTSRTSAQFRLAFKLVHPSRPIYSVRIGLAYSTGFRVEGRRILLFDDLFRSRATMKAVTSALYDQGHARDVSALPRTRTRSRQ